MIIMIIIKVIIVLIVFNGKLCSYYSVVKFTCSKSKTTHRISPLNMLKVHRQI